jgi:hypothetical protein
MFQGCRWGFVADGSGAAPAAAELEAAAAAAQMELSRAGILAGSGDPCRGAGGACQSGGSKLTYTRQGATRPAAVGEMEPGRSGAELEAAAAGAELKLARAGIRDGSGGKWETPAPRRERGLRAKQPRVRTAEGKSKRGRGQMLNVLGAEH